MSNNRLILILVTVALIVVAGLTTWQAIAMGEVVSEVPAAATDSPRAPLDECFDLSLSETCDK